MYVCTIYVCLSYSSSSLSITSTTTTQTLFSQKRSFLKTSLLQLARTNPSLIHISARTQSTMSTAAASQNAAQLEANKIIEQLGNVQRELTEQIQSREILEMQEQENKIVADEFGFLGDEAKVFKLTGPVLLPQSKTEAEQNVNKRLEFIKNEIERVEASISEKQKKVK